MPPRVSPPRTTRLFFALWPPVEVAERIAVCRDALALDGRPVARERLHLTLAFVGCCDGAKAQALCARASRLAVPAFELVLDHADHFAGPAITCLAGSVRTPELERLAAELATDAVDNGCFRPHITLARDAAPLAPLAITPIRWRVTAFSLVASGENGVPGAYREWANWALI